MELKNNEGQFRIKKIHVEIGRNPRSTLRKNDILDFVKTSLKDVPIQAHCVAGRQLNLEDLTSKTRGGDYTCSKFDSSISSIYADPEYIVLPQTVGGANLSSKENLDSSLVSPSYEFHIFDLHEDGEEVEYMEQDEEEQISASHHWMLPSKSFDGLWESLIFSIEIKNRLLNYINTTLLFSERGVNSSLVSWNKVILLHGPPGTGKTSLCKALAQKAVIRLGNKFKYGQIVEINSHSLFSKWFSESGKLVMKMFENINELIEDPQALIFLLIDEIESLAQCRQSAENGNEPTDSIRAVNALLTQLDRMKKYNNVIILTTSNIVGSIDSAFVDRADLKIYIGSPPTEVIYDILASSINELLRVNILMNGSSSSCQSLPSYSDFLILLTDKGLEKQNQACEVVHATPLLKIARKCAGLSGRTLRKIPFLTFSNLGSPDHVCLPTFLTEMDKTVDTVLIEEAAMQNTQRNE